MRPLMEAISAIHRKVSPPMCRSIVTLRLRGHTLRVRQPRPETRMIPTIARTPLIAGAVATARLLVERQTGPDKLTSGQRSRQSVYTLRSKGGTRVKGPLRAAALSLAALGFYAPMAISQPAEVDRYPAEKWAPLGLYPAGAQATLLYGAPDKPGLMVGRIKYPANYRLPAHTHNVDFVVTVLSGTYYSGIGERPDPASMKAVGAGGTVVEPAGVPHYAETRGESAVVQFTGMTPGNTSYVNPAEDPRKK